MDQEVSETSVESPLIPSSENGLGYGNSLVKNKYGEIIVELKKQMGLARPLVVVSFLQCSLLMIAVMFVGHLGELSLGSSSMATSFAGVIGFSFMLGMGSGLETLCGQAYGAKQYHMLGILIQGAMLVLSLVSVPVAALWGCTEFGLGNKGAALSIAISYWINVLILAIYVKLSPACEKTWTGFSKEAPENIFEFLELVIPSALMVCSGQWSYEFLVFMSGLLRNPKLETSMMSISLLLIGNNLLHSLNTSTVIFRVPFGFGSAVSTRVSNELGTGRPYAARLAVQIVIFLAATEGLFVNVVAVALRSIWGYMYTNKDKVERYLASIMPILAISNFMDGMQVVLSGTARGCGWQKIGAYVNMGAYYFAGLPTALILTFVFHFGGKGLWMGIICGSGLQTLSLFAITMCTNSEQEAKKAKERVFASRIQEHEAS